MRMLRVLPSLLALAVCATSAVAVLYWSGQDKQGQFRAEHLQADGGLVLFFVGPYLVLAAAAVVCWGHGPLSLISLGITLVMAVIAVSVVWSDHDTHLRTPPGREVTPMLGFLATILLWLGSTVLLIGMGIARIVLRGRPQAA